VPFADLETMSLPDYVAQEAAKESMWFFLHIPKTAGSSFGAELAIHAAPHRSFVIGGPDQTLTHHQKVTLAVDKLIETMVQEPVRAAQGHIPWQQTQRILAARPGTRVFSFLRDPEARVISAYRYQRTRMHSQHKDFIAQFPTLQSYIESPESQNMMSIFLWGEREFPSPDELVQHVRMNFTFIGLVEMYLLSYASIFAMMGNPDARPTEYKRKTPDTRETEVSITPELREMIRETNRLDQTVYDYVSGVLGRHRDALRAAQRPKA
jgi:hypothetical protein